MKLLIGLMLPMVLVLYSCKKQNKTSSSVVSSPMNTWHLKQKSIWGNQWKLSPGECDIVMDTTLKTLTVSGPKASIFIPAGTYTFKFTDYVDYVLSTQGWVKQVRKILNTTPKKHYGYMVFYEYPGGLQIVIDGDFGIADDEEYFSFGK